MALFRAVESAGPSRRRLFEDPYAAALLAGPLKAFAGFDKNAPGLVVWEGVVSYLPPR